ncbi:hypothetical protein [Rhodococcoides kroppenstedtii]|uniref:hypothetical protein n=1 Tax=Rhodococcoides kroppenstedtii TaxID=293050 RepID=UPI003634C397
MGVQSRSGSAVFDDSSGSVGATGSTGAGSAGNGAGASSGSAVGAAVGAVVLGAVPCVVAGAAGAAGAVVAVVDGSAADGTVVHAAGVVVAVVVAGGVVVVEVDVVAGAHESTGAGTCGWICGAELVGVVGVVDGCAVATAPSPVAINAAIMPAVNTPRGEPSETTVSAVAADEGST